MLGLVSVVVCASAGAAVALHARPAGAKRGLAGDDGSAYHYMPEQRLLICSCAKCGSTSLFSFVFREALGRPWNYTGVPYIQDVLSPRWENKFVLLNSRQARALMASPGAYKFALSRDPKSRIFSAWKSKAACDGRENWGTDVGDRSYLVPTLLALAGLPEAGCLGFEDFVHALALVHRRGLASELNEHFRPQQHGCFRDFPPPEWSKVASISDGSAAREIALRLGSASATGFPRVHSSIASGPVHITEAARRLLEEITMDEYRVLATRREVSAVQ